MSEFLDRFYADGESLETFVGALVTMLVVAVASDGDNADRRAFRCHRAFEARRVSCRRDRQQALLRLVSRLFAAQIQGRRGTAGCGHLLTADQSPCRSAAAALAADTTRGNNQYPRRLL